MPIRSRIPRWTSAGAFALLLGLDAVASLTAQPAGSCIPGPEALCLLDGRFRVEAQWTVRPLGENVAAQAIPLSPKTGAFWFFEPENLEVMVKVLDGSSLNHRFWVFLGSLSDVEYRVTVTDTATGERKVYFNPPGHTYGLTDTNAFHARSGAFCGGIAGIPCTQGQVCDLDPGLCQGADIGGTCVPQPGGCLAVWNPVCGCDGKTYSNDCERLIAGVQKDHDGPCTP